MCLSSSARVVSVEGLEAVVELTGGARRRASTLLLPDVQPGELVTVAAGTVLDRLDADEAAALDALVAKLQGDPDDSRS